MTHLLAFTDLTPSGDAGVAAGMRLAEVLGARVTLLHVVTRPGGSGSAAADRRDVHLAHVQRELLAAQLRVRRAHPTLEITGLTRTGDVTAEMLLAIDDLRPTFVAVGEGRGAWSRAVRGSPAAEVLRGGGVSVITAREGAAARPWTRILVPFDFGPASRDAVELGVTLARRLRATVRLLLVSPGSHAIDLQPASEALADVAGATQGALQSFVDDYPVRAVRMEIGVRFGRLATGVADEALAWGAGLVVIGTHDHAPAHFCAESAAQSIMRVASCPVLTCPSPLPSRLAAVTAGAVTRRAAVRGHGRPSMPIR